MTNYTGNLNQVQIKSIAALNLNLKLEANGLRSVL